MYVSSLDSWSSLFFRGGVLAIVASKLVDFGKEAKRNRTNGILKSRGFEVVSIPRRNLEVMNPRRIHCWYQFHCRNWVARVSS